MIVDAWIQHPTPTWAREPMFTSIRKWMGIDEIPEVPIDLTAQLLGAAGVDRALICAWEGPQGTLISNDQVAAWVQAHPELLVGIAAVDIRQPMQAVRELRRAVTELGMKGLRMLPWLWNLPPDDRRMYPLYVACIELGVPFCLQVGHAGPLCPSEPGRLACRSRRWCWRRRAPANE